MNMTESYDQQPGQQYQLNESHGNQDDRSRFLKPLKVPTFSGDKQKFEDFWALFRSLVDESSGASESENGKTVTMPHRECVGSHLRSRGHNSKIRREERNIKIKIWWTASTTASLHGSTRTDAIN